MKVNTIVIASNDKNKFMNFNRDLSNLFNCKTKYTHDYKTTLDAINKSPMLLIIDDTLSMFDSITLLQQAIMMNAFLFVAIVSNQNSTKFKERFEGLGVLMQISDPFNKTEIVLLSKKLIKACASLSYK